MEDLANWKVHIEEPVHTNYKGIEVYKLTTWVQGPVMLQALNILENFDLKAMGYDSARYIHTLYQAMNLAFADRDFYYGDPYFPPAAPIQGLLSKEYARERAKLDQARAQRPGHAARRSLSLPGREEPVHGRMLKSWHSRMPARHRPQRRWSHALAEYDRTFRLRHDRRRGRRRKGLGRCR